MKAHLAKCRVAHLPAILEDLFEIQTLRRCRINMFTVDSIEERLSFTFAIDPLAMDIVP
jgi:hypothetical protein